ncbi:MAG: hypothetical protein K0S56_326 [Microvirga sp.]|jgi:hypothetical protein|nr:hypothetical protein [Microvirga sp.]
MIATLLSFLPAWAPSFGAGGMALLGVGLLGYSLLPLVRLPRLAAAGGIVCLAAACYLAGVGSAQAVCEADKLREQVAARDRAIAQRDALLEEQNEQIRRVQALNTRLSDIAAQADDDAEDMRHEVSKLEEDLRTAGKGAGCDFSDDEYRRVRELIDHARRPAAGNRAPR